MDSKSKQHMNATHPMNRISTVLSELINKHSLKRKNLQTKNTLSIQQYSPQHISTQCHMHTTTTGREFNPLITRICMNTGNYAEFAVILCSSRNLLSEPIFCELRSGTKGNNQNKYTVHVLIVFIWQKQVHLTLYHEKHGAKIRPKLSHCCSTSFNFYQLIFHKQTFYTSVIVYWP